MATETRQTEQVDMLEEGSRSVCKSPESVLNLHINFSQQHSASQQNEGENLQGTLESSLDASNFEGEVGFGGGCNSQVQYGEGQVF
jgi:hypothetical protein